MFGQRVYGHMHNKTMRKITLLLSHVDCFHRVGWCFVCSIDDLLLNTVSYTLLVSLVQVVDVINEVMHSWQYAEPRQKELDMLVCF